MRTDIRGKPGWPLMGRTVWSRFLRWAKTSLPALAIILLGGWVALPQVHVGEDPPLDLEEGMPWFWTTGRVRELHLGKKSSKLELRDKVGGLGGGASVRTSRGPALPCCCVRGSRRGRRMKPCVNMNGYKSQSWDETLWKRVSNMIQRYKIESF